MLATTKTNQKFSMLSLPNEILLIILFCLEYVDVLRFSHTCHWIRSVILSEKHRTNNRNFEHFKSLRQKMRDFFCVIYSISNVGNDYRDVLMQKTKGALPIIIFNLIRRSSCMIHFVHLMTKMFPNRVNFTFIYDRMFDELVTTKGYCKDNAKTNTDMDPLYLGIDTVTQIVQSRSKNDEKHKMANKLGDGLLEFLISFFQAETIYDNLNHTSYTNQTSLLRIGIFIRCILAIKPFESINALVDLMRDVYIRSPLLSEPIRTFSQHDMGIISTLLEMNIDDFRLTMQIEDTQNIFHDAEAKANDIAREREREREMASEGEEASEDEDDAYTSENEEEPFYRAQNKQLQSAKSLLSLIEYIRSFEG